MTEAMTEIAVSLRDVYFSYDGTTPALQRISLDIPRGQWVCLLGANGSGKSTLARHINGLLLPDQGEVKVFGLSTTQDDIFEIRCLAGMVFQNPDDQLVADTIEDDVAFGPENMGMEPAEMRRRVTEALHIVGLDGFEKHRTNQLSGGQRQRVAIAGALALKPRLIIFDESSSMLDPRGRRELMRLIQKLHAQGYTIISITHDMEEVIPAQRIIVMQSGKICVDCTPQEFLCHPNEVRSLNLETTTACQLAHRLIALGVPVSLTADAQVLEEELCRLR